MVTLTVSVFLTIFSQGIMFYLIPFYFLRYMFSERKIEYLYFSILALCAFGYETFCLLIYTQDSLISKLIGQSGQQAISSLFIFFLIKFSESFLAYKLKSLFRIYYTLLLLLTVLVLIPLPFPLGYSLDSVHETIVIFGSLTVQTYREIQGGLFSIMALFIDFAGIIIVAGMHLKGFRKSQKMDKSFLLCGIILFLCCVTNDMLVSFSIYQFIYTAEFGFLGVVFGMAISLNIQENTLRKNLHQSEVHLTFEQKKLDMTLNAITEAVITVSPKGILTMANQSFWDLIQGKKPIGLVLDQYFMIKTKAEETQQNPNEALALKGRTVLSHEVFTIISVFDIKKIVEISGSVIQADIPELAGSVYVLSDITEKNRLETELVRLEKLDSLGTLAAGIAHDFNNTLAGVLGNITMCKLDIPTDNQAVRMLENAEKAIMKARNLTQQLIFFSSSSSASNSSCDIVKVITDSCEFIFAGKKIKPLCNFSSPSFNVQAAESDMNRVFQNLLINAEEAMAEGGIVHISAKPGTHHGQDKMVEVRIGDTGSGIEPEVLDRIFDPFYTTKKTGTGLGLFAVHSILSRIHGSISVESIPGRGSVFTLLLPAHSKKTADLEDSSSVAKGGHGKILIVDDDDLIRKTCALLTQRLGYISETAANGNQAIALYRKAFNASQAYDTVILDLIIPGEKGGESIFDELKQINPELKAIAMSGTIGLETSKNLMLRGFVGILHKPFTFNELSVRLKECCPQKNQPEKTDRDQKFTD